MLHVVVYNRDTRWDAPLTLADLVERTEHDGPAQLALSYDVVDLVAVATDDLPRPNLLTWVAEVEQSVHSGALPERVRELGEWLAAERAPGLTRTFDLWLGAMGRKLGVSLPSIREYEEASAVLANKIDRWEADIRQQGIEQGVERGIQQETARLRRLAERRFGAAAAEQLAARDLTCQLTRHDGRDLGLTRGRRCHHNRIVTGQPQRVGHLLRVLGQGTHHHHRSCQFEALDGRHPVAYGDRDIGAVNHRHHRVPGGGGEILDLGRYRRLDARRQRYRDSHGRHREQEIFLNMKSSGPQEYPLRNALCNALATRVASSTGSACGLTTLWRLSHPVMKRVFSREDHHEAS